MKRECGDCTKCCEGHFYSNIHGHDMYKGRPCFFLNKSCTIYEDRPVTCREFYCEWLVNNNIPEWMKPTLINAIIIGQKHNGIFYYKVVEAGEVLKSKVLSWVIQWCLSNNHNLEYVIEEGRNRIGSKEFKDLRL